MAKKFLAVMLAVSAFLLFFPGCVGNEEKTQQPNENNTDHSGGEGADGGAVTEKILPDLPEGLNFNGETFTFLVTGPGYGYGYYETVDIYTAEQNGETLNDAVYIRNRNVEEKLNINIAERKSDSVAADAKKAITAGDASYDAIFAHMFDSSSMAQNHLVMNIKEIAYMDLDKPWWDKNAENELSIKNKLYFTTGDISTKVKACTRLQIFNKKLIKDFDFGDPYEYVKNNTWTFDVYAQMVKSVYVDVNGNGERDDGDVYGFILDSSPLWPVRSFGERLTTNDSDGYPEITINNDRFYNAAGKVMDLYNDETVCRPIGSMKVGGDFSNVYTYARSLFTQDKFLFHLGLPLILDEFRNMESDFGLLPCPKFDENQSRYYHIVDGEAVMLSVPITSNGEKAGPILEAMAAESMYTVTPAYNEILLKRKYVRDNESEFILDIVNQTRTYDLCTIFGWGGMNGLMSNPDMKKNNNPASEIDKMYEKALLAIEKTVAAFEAE
ncbi:MAG: hypothetical protein FWD23_08920 [Oscillospiraceae bacterium]|nr:hypothetical protein [Oscillospiraceae bacterium]